MLLFKLNFHCGQTQIINILLLSSLVNGLQIPCFLLSTIIFRLSQLHLPEAEELLRSHHGGSAELNSTSTSNRNAYLHIAVGIATLNICPHMQQ